MILILIIIGVILIIIGNKKKKVTQDIKKAKIFIVTGIILILVGLIPLFIGFSMGFDAGIKKALRERVANQR